MKHPRYFTILVLLFILGACDIKNSNIAPEASFVRVYESRNVSESYYPQDITQLSDGSYLILSALIDSSLINYPKVSVVATNSLGETLAQIVLPQSYSNPVQGWIKFDNNRYLVCMDDITLQTKLIQVSLNGETLNWEEVRAFDRDMPLYACSDENSLVILSYNRGSRSSFINKYDNNFNDQWESQLSDNAQELEGDVIEHLQKIRDQFPVFIGTIETGTGSNDYFINCFTNYSMAMVYVNGTSGSISGGRVFSFQEQTGLTAALHIENDTFALARYHSGNCYVAPKAGLNRDEVVVTGDLDDILISEFREDTPMDIFQYEHGESTYIVFASTTRSNQIMLLFFDKETGEQAYVHTLGQGNPVEVSNVIKTEDGGLAILCKTNIYNKYQRIIFYKLDPDQLKIED